MTDTITTDVMLDLETMGTGPDAAIVAIGAVQMDIERGTVGDTFCATICLRSAVAAGGVMDADTVLWWLRQTGAARQALDRDALPIEHALAEFARWLPPKARVWGNGADFDNVILARAYHRLGLAQPWGTYSNRCYRTLKAQRRNIEIVRTGTHHHALDDAVSQAQHLLAIMESLKPNGAAADQLLLAALQHAVAEYGRPGGPWNVPGDPGTWIASASRAIAAATGGAHASASSART